MINQTGRVSFGRSVKDFFKGYVDFKGRTTRSGYWNAVLFLFLVGIGVGIVSGILISMTGITGSGDVAFGGALVVLLILAGLAFFGLIIPTIALQIRRFRDAGMTGKGALVVTLISMFFGASSGTVDYTEAGVVVINNSGDAIYSIITIVMLVICLLPTDEMLTTSSSKFMRFFLRPVTDRKDMENLTEEVVAEIKNAEVQKEAEKEEETLEEILEEDNEDI